MLKVFNPYSGKLVCELPYEEEKVLEGKMGLASSSYSAWRRVPLDERVILVRGGLD